MERSVRLAENALSQELLFFVIHFSMESRSLDVLALHASVIHLNQFWKDSSSLGDDSSDLDKSVEMHLSQVSKLVLNWKILDSDENLFGGVLIVRIHFRY